MNLLGKTICVFFLMAATVSAGMTLDGTDDFIPASSYLGISGTAARSVSFWFNSTDTAGTDHLLGWGDNGTGAGEGFRFSQENGVIWGRFNTGVTAQWGTGLNDGAWHHFTYSFPSAGVNQDAVVYIDGSLSTGTFANGTTALNTEATKVVTMGRFPGANTGYYSGNVNEVAIWSTNLSAAEQQQLYNARVKRLPLQISPANLVVYLPLDDVADGASGDGISFFEFKGNAFTGDNGANNTGLTAKAEAILTYP